MFPGHFINKHEEFYQHLSLSVVPQNPSCETVHCSPIFFSCLQSCPCFPPLSSPLNFLSWAVPFLCHGPQDTAFVTKRKRPTSSVLLVLPDAGFPRALIPGLSKEVLEGSRAKGSDGGGARAGIGVCWAQQRVGEPVLAQSVSTAPLVIRHGFGEWSSENPPKLMPASNLSVCPNICELPSQLTT